jgi:SHS2 domain-containing protein
VLATKFGLPFAIGPHERGTSLLHIEAACDESLRRLKTDCIDLYGVHIDAPADPCTLDELVCADLPPAAHAPKDPFELGRSALPGGSPVSHSEAMSDEPHGSSQPAADVAGHRSLLRTAGYVIEAWGPDQVTCLTEALVALVEQFADVTDTPTTRPLPIGAEAGEPSEVLLSLLESVIDTIDVFAVVPVHFHLDDTADGGVTGDMEVVPARSLRLAGPAPTAASHHDLSMVGDENGWRCHALIDV